MRERRHLTTLWAFTACYRDSFTFYPTYKLPSTFYLCRREPRHLTTLWAFTFCYRDSFTFYPTYKLSSTFYLCRDKSVRIGTGYQLDSRGTASRQTMRLTQPPIQLVTGTLSPGVKRPGSEANHSPPSSTEVKNGGAAPPHPHTSSWPDA
jgi:hypothetical protein